MAFEALNKALCDVVGGHPGIVVLGLEEHVRNFVGRTTLASSAKRSPLGQQSSYGGGRRSQP